MDSNTYPKPSQFYSFIIKRFWIGQEQWENYVYPIIKIRHLAHEFIAVTIQDITPSLL